MAGKDKGRNHTLVIVPRAHFGKYHQMPFADLLAAAERGEDGLTVSDAHSYGSAFFREGDKGGPLEGKSSLYFQGWV